MSSICIPFPLNDKTRTAAHALLPTAHRRMATASGALHLALVLLDAETAALDTAEAVEALKRYVDITKCVRIGLRADGALRTKMARDLATLRKRTGRLISSNALCQLALTLFDETRAAELAAGVWGGAGEASFRAIEGRVLLLDGCPHPVGAPLVVHLDEVSANAALEAVVPPELKPRITVAQVVITPRNLR